MAQVSASERKPVWWRAAIRSGAGVPGFSAVVTELWKGPQGALGLAGE